MAVGVAVCDAVGVLVAVAVSVGDGVCVHVGVLDAVVVTICVIVGKVVIKAMGVGAMNLHRSQPPHPIPTNTVAAMSSKSATVPMIFNLAVVNDSP
ncbi:MAG: hypothetical protein PVF77_10790 [Anaerolineae bacterium]|jgi:hypothetical protein